MRSSRAIALGSALAVLVFLPVGACSIPRGPEMHGSVTDDDGGGPDAILLEAAPPSDAGYELPATDPHALVGVDPPHGSFAGGEHRIVRGNGFTSKVRVWFGANEVPSAELVPIDPTRVQVTVPAGVAGAVEVKAQNGDDASTARTLAGGYTYDAFYADPSTGPTSGGTVVTFHGQATTWGAGTTVDVGGHPCGGVKVVSATELSCTVAKSPPGAKSVTITTADQVATTVLDAFTYADSDNGYKGGLSGAKLASQLKVLAYDNYTGDPLVGAIVVAGDALATAITKATDANGVALFQGSLGPTRSVTVAAKCHQPITFVNVPVDTVTAYLNPVLSPACSSGDPPSVGGHPGAGAAVSGELVWPNGSEFKKGAWTNVPFPIGPNEKRAAYVFVTDYAPNRDFTLPDASLAVHDDTPGTVGYAFAVGAPIGNLALYALAGIEDRSASPPKFTAYAMGVVQGVSTQPGATTSNVYIPMNATLDHAITMAIAPPAPGPSGPDRVKATVSVAIGNDGFAILPGMQKTTLLPIAGNVSFVGVPALKDGLAGAHYISTARAGTGPTLTYPASVVGQLATTDSSQLVTVDQFVQVPVLAYPGANGAWDGQHLSVSFASGGAPIDLVVYDVEMGGGLVGWTIAVPGNVHDVTLPDLASLSSNLGVLPGNVSITVSAAHIDAFDYGSLLYRHLSSRGWNSYAVDDFPSHL